MEHKQMILDCRIPSGSSMFTDDNNGQNVRDCVLVINTLCLRKRLTCDLL